MEGEVLELTTELIEPRRPDLISHNPLLPTPVFNFSWIQISSSGESAHLDRSGADLVKIIRNV